MQKKIVSFFGPGQSSSSKRPRAEDEDDISSGSNSETDENATYTSDDLEEFIIEDDSVITSVVILNVISLTFPHRPIIWKSPREIVIFNNIGVMIIRG